MSKRVGWDGVCGALGTKLKKILCHNQMPQELNKFLCIVQIFYVLYLVQGKRGE